MGEIAGKMKIGTDILGRLVMVLLLLSFFLSGSGQLSYNRLDAWMNANTKAMGGRAILVVFKDGKMVYSKSVNDMNNRQKSLNKYVAKKQHKEADLEEYTLNSKQLMASCSKWFSAALVMTFVDEGKIRLDDTVGTWLPVLSLHGKGNITISECLSHLTGIQAPPIKESLKEMKNIHSMDQAVGEIAEMPMEGTHGKIFHYSNTGLQIAAAVIEKISGQSFEELFAERISGPLGLKNTDFGNGPVAFPAGGARSTPEDYLTFLTMILDRGKYKGTSILSEKGISEMEINRIGPEVKIAYSPAEAEGLGYGYGEWVVKNIEGGKRGLWFTSPGLFGSFPWVDNEKNYCGFLMTFYLNNKGRQERYFDLKQLVDQTLQSN
jgi:CubicO group peptidase (beta-lactamase class C family)